MIYKKEKEKYRLGREDLQNPRSIFNAVREAINPAKSAPCARKFRQEFSPFFIRKIDDCRDWDEIPQKILISILREANRLIAIGDLKVGEILPDKCFDLPHDRLLNTTREYESLPRSLRNEMIIRRAFARELLHKRTQSRARMVEIQYRENEDQPYSLRESDVILPGRFAARIHEAGDPISLIIRGRLTAGIQRELADFAESGNSASSLCDFLVIEINRILFRRELLYEIDHIEETSYYARVLAEKETLWWLSGKVKLNRLLLEIAFPDAVRRLQIRNTDLSAGQEHPDALDIDTLRGQAEHVLNKAQNAGTRLSVLSQADPIEKLRSKFVAEGMDTRKQRDAFEKELREIDQRMKLKYTPIGEDPPSNFTRLEYVERLLDDYSLLRDLEKHLRNEISRRNEEAVRATRELREAQENVRGLEKKLNSSNLALAEVKRMGLALEKELNNWKSELGGIGQDPREIVEKWNGEHRWSKTVGSLLAELDQAIRSFTTRRTDVCAAHTAKKTETFKAWIGGAQQEISSLWVFAKSVTIDCYYRIHGGDTLSPSLLLKDFEQVQKEYSRLKTQEHTYGQLERSTPRSGNVTYVAGALDAVSEALSALARPEGAIERILASTGLEPVSLASDVRAIAEENRHLWHRLLLEATEELAEETVNKEAETKVFRSFLDYFLSGYTISALTQVKRFQQITAVYCRNVDDPEIAAITKVTGGFREALAELEGRLRVIGIELAPFRFFEFPDAFENWDFQAQERGRAHMLKSPLLHAITVNKVRQQEGRLENTLGDMSLWGFRCHDFPELSRVSTGWLVQGWELL